MKMLKRINPFKRISDMAEQNEKRERRAKIARTEKALFDALPPWKQEEIHNREMAERYRGFGYSDAQHAFYFETNRNLPDRNDEAIKAKLSQMTELQATSYNNGWDAFVGEMAHEENMAKREREAHEWRAREAEHRHAQGSHLRPLAHPETFLKQPKDTDGRSY